MKFDVLDAGNATNLDRAFASIGASGAQGIVVMNDPFFVENRAKLVQFAASKARASRKSTIAQFWHESSIIR